MKKCIGNHTLLSAIMTVHTMLNLDCNENSHDDEKKRYHSFGALMFFGGMIQDVLDPIALMNPLLSEYNYYYPFM